jgi:hypothetical protein
METLLTQELNKLLLQDLESQLNICNRPNRLKSRLLKELSQEKEVSYQDSKLANTSQI